MTVACHAFHPEAASVADADLSNDLFFAAAGRWLLAQGGQAVPTQGGTLGERVRQALAATGDPDAVVVGAVPFDVRQPAQLWIPAHCQRGVLDEPTRLPFATGHGGEVATMRAGTVRLMPEPAMFEALVQQALGRLEQENLRKLVLARTLSFDLDAPLDQARLLEKLLAQHPQGHVFSVPLDAASGCGVLLGASPELLVRRQGRRITLNPLAGSAARQHDPAQDRCVAEALLRSDKDRREHAIVIEDIVRILQPYCRTLTVPDGPELLATDTLWHLSSVLEGELYDLDMTSLDLALALHPTPAVCGWPTAQAFAAIEDLEPFSRDFYAGFVGWCAASGDGEWAVTLRCGVCHPGQVRLYAGAGVVPGSVPAMERAETGVKFQTMLNGLGVTLP